MLILAFLSMRSNAYQIVELLAAELTEQEKVEDFLLRRCRFCVMKRSYRAVVRERAASVDAACG